MNSSISVLLSVIVNGKQKCNRPFSLQLPLVSKDVFRDAAIQCLNNSGYDDVLETIRSERFSLQRFDSAWDTYVDASHEEILDRDKVQLQFEVSSNAQVWLIRNFYFFVQNEENRVINSVNSFLARKFFSKFS